MIRVVIYTYFILHRDQPKAETFRFLQFRKAQKLNRNVSAFRLLSAERGVSAERLSFCRNTLFLQKYYCISAESFWPRCFCRNQPFCRNLPLSAETNLFLQKLTSFCRKAGISVNYGFRPKLSAFCILSFCFGRQRFG